MQNDTPKNVEKYSDNPLSQNVFFKVTQKAEKIATAIYMVSSFIEEEDPLHRHLRSYATELLADMYSCLEASSVHKTRTLSRSIITVEHLISLLTIAKNMGLISEMNTQIIGRELMTLQSVIHREFHLHRELDSNREPHTQIDQHLFLNKLFAREESQPQKAINDTETVKDTKMSFKNNVLYNKGHKKTKKAISEERQQKILGIIKDKKNVSMKDIATRITNCTEKTLQRDLMSLIEAGHIEKEGSRRWSTYRIRQ